MVYDYIFHCNVTSLSLADDALSGVKPIVFFMLLHKFRRASWPMQNRVKGLREQRRRMIRKMTEGTRLEKSLTCRGFCGAFGSGSRCLVLPCD